MEIGPINPATGKETAPINPVDAGKEIGPITPAKNKSVETGKEIGPINPKLAITGLEIDPTPEITGMETGTINPVHKNNEIDSIADIVGIETDPISPVNNHNLVETEDMSHCP